MNSFEVEQLCDNLIKSVQVSIKPIHVLLPDEKKEANNFIEKIKDDFNYAIPCGFCLWNRSDNTIKHLGLKLLEETIQYHWNDLSIVEKQKIKCSVMEIVINGGDYPRFLNDKISCLVVEMAKREWPQQWPDLLQELKTTTEAGPSQTELVLLILMRLVEDVAILKKMEHLKRKNDIHVALNQNLNFLFELFFTLLESNYTLYKTLEANPVAAQPHCRVTKVVYETLALFSEWAPIEYVMKHHEKLFFSICQLITDKNIRLSAADCFLKIVSKKARSHHLLILFDQSVMDAIFGAARLAITEDITDENYLFLKTLFQVLTTLGLRLCSVWGKETGVNEPTSFPVYLDAVLSFTEHPSLIIFNYAALFFDQLLRLNIALRSSTVAKIYPRWLSIAGSKVRKHGFPSRQDCEMASKYSAFDYYTDSEYNSFFLRVRSTILSGIKSGTVVYPDVNFAYVQDLFKKCLEITEEVHFISNGKTEQLRQEENSDDTCLTPLQTEWNRLSLIMNVIFPQLLKADNYKDYQSEIRSMLVTCLKYQSKDVVLLSSVLSCISALCSYLPLMPDLVPLIVDTLLSTFCYRYPIKVPGSSNQHYKAAKKPVFSLRNHACAIFVLLCKNNGQTLIIHFDSIDSMITAAKNQFSDISSLEKCHLAQGLSLLNNHVPSFDKQQSFLLKMFEPMKQDWLALTEGINNDLVSLIGLDKPPVNLTDVIASSAASNRSVIHCSLNLIYYVSRVVAIPSDRNILNRGGFSYGSNGDHFVCRNPMTEIIMPFLPNLFGLLKAHNCLFLPRTTERFSQEYKKALDLPTSEHLSLLNMHSQIHSVSNSGPVCENDNLEKMKTYMKTFHEILCECVAYLASCLGHQFYEIPNMRDIVLNSVLFNFTMTPDFKIMKLIKSTFKSITGNCPSELYESFNLPVIHHFCIHMSEYLSQRWEYVSSVTQSDYYDETATEMIDFVIIQCVTRDYLDVLKELIVAKPPAVKSENDISNNLVEEIDGNMFEEEEMNVDAKSQTGPEQLSPLGKLILSCDAIFQPIVLTLCKALSWNDSLSLKKANSLLQVCVKTMVEEGRQQHLTEDVVKHLLISVLAGIHTHGQEQTSLIPLIETCLLLYEKLALHFPVINQTLMSLPSVNESMIDSLSSEMTLAKEQILLQRKQTKPLRVMKETFKNIVEGIVGKNISETFQKQVQIRELQPMFRNPRAKQPRLDDSETNLDICRLFDPLSLAR